MVKNTPRWLRLLLIAVALLALIARIAIYHNFAS